MKDFDKIIAEFGEWVSAPQQADGVKYQLKNRHFRQQQRCSGEYPFCTRGMNIHYHTLTNQSAKPETVLLRCKICGTGGIFNLAQWSADIAKSKKSE